MALRARIVLAASTGATNTAIAAKLGVVIPTVGKWRRRFLRQRIAGLLDEPRVGAPRTISDADVEVAIRTTLESRPKDATQWSTRSLAKKLGLSQSTVSRMWRAFLTAKIRSMERKLADEQGTSASTGPKKLPSPRLT